MHTETIRRRAFGEFYDAMGSTVRKAAAFIRRPSVHHASALRVSLLQTLGSIDVLNTTLDYPEAQQPPGVSGTKDLK